MLVADFFQNLHHLGGIGAVGHTDLHHHPADAVAQHPVGHLGGDQLGVRHQHIGTVESADLGVADAHPLHVALGGADHDPVARLDRTLKQQDQAGNKVVDDVLQAKTDTHRERTGNDRQVLEVHAGHTQRHQQGDTDDGVAGQRDDGLARPRIQAGVGQPAISQLRTQPARQGQHQQEHQQGDQQAPRHNGNAADLETIGDTGLERSQAVFPHIPTDQRPIDKGRATQQPQHQTPQAQPRHLFAGLVAEKLAQPLAALIRVDIQHQQHVAERLVNHPQQQQAAERAVNAEIEQDRQRAIAQPQRHRAGHQGNRQGDAQGAQQPHIRTPRQREQQPFADQRNQADVDQAAAQAAVFGEHRAGIGQVQRQADQQQVEQHPCRQSTDAAVHALAQQHLDQRRDHQRQQQGQQDRAENARFGKISGQAQRGDPRHPHQATRQHVGEQYADRPRSRRLRLGIAATQQARQEGGYRQQHRQGQRTGNRRRHPVIRIE